MTALDKLSHGTRDLRALRQARDEISCRGEERVAKSTINQKADLAYGAPLSCRTDAANRRTLRQRCAKQRVEPASPVQELAAAGPIRQRRWSSYAPVLHRLGWTDHGAGIRRSRKQSGPGQAEARAVARDTRLFLRASRLWLERIRARPARCRTCRRAVARVADSGAHRRAAETEGAFCGRALHPHVSRAFPGRRWWIGLRRRHQPIRVSQIAGVGGCA
jgi:hypothetical protein